MRIIVLVAVWLVSISISAEGGFAHDKTADRDAASDKHPGERPLPEGNRTTERGLPQKGRRATVLHHMGQSVDL